ncbi:MAG TPA: hypothetical protein VD884_13260 [Ohtaekwangia sp.]|nr:hypothetical protein [Ohtaekwangia sp.]
MNIPEHMLDINITLTQSEAKRLLKILRDMEDGYGEWGDGTTQGTEFYLEKGDKQFIQQLIEVITHAK